MIRTTIFLPPEFHRALKHLAVEKSCSMADLLRTAAESVYKEDLEDLGAARSAWREHLRHPARSVSAERFFARRSRRRP